MASDNVVTLVGNITDEPELRFTPGGDSWGQGAQSGGQGGGAPVGSPQQNQGGDDW
jgi:hypothetical protein